MNAASLRDDVIDLLVEAEDQVVSTVTCNDSPDARASAMSALINIRMARGTLEAELERLEKSNGSKRDDIRGMVAASQGRPSS